MSVYKMKELIDKLNKYSYEYYTLGKPSISDESYDKLYDDLLKLEEETGIIFSNSPTQNVGYKVLPFLNKSTHEVPMLSLKKTKDVKELYKHLNNKPCILMHKLDGLTVSITYENGKIIKAETRGNGKTGEDITHNISSFTNIPLTINDKRHIIITGEAIITYDTFNKINDTLPQDKKYKTPRNLASGTIRQLDSSICKQRKPRFIAYNLYGTDLNSKTKQLLYLHNLGFETVSHIQLFENISIQTLEETIESLKTLAKDNDIPIDGLVTTYDNIKYGESLGLTSHHPKHSLAFKFNDEVEFTHLIRVKYQVGRTGKITPVAIFEPVELDGTTVERASIHNLSILRDLELYKGDEIGIYKANQIIPQIKDNLNKGQHDYINGVGYKLGAVKCPCCGTPTKIINDIEYCTNPLCKEKIIGSITHYCSRDAMNIVGLSRKTIEKLIDINLLKSINDIYYLKKPKAKKQILQLEGFGEKSYNKLINSIEKSSKERKLANFIYALGIPNVGLSTAENIVNYCNQCNIVDTLNKIYSTTYDEWLNMEDSGEILSETLVNYFKNVNNLTLISYLTQEELTFIDDNKQITNNNSFFKDKTVVITGTFTNMSRIEITNKIKELGGKVTGSVSKKTDYLIVGENAGSKLKKAEQLETVIINEEELNKILGGK